jgi:hypothetical protein
MSVIAVIGSIEDTAASVSIEKGTNMEIKRAGWQASAKGPSDWFTGNVRIDPLFEAPDPAFVQGASVTSSRVRGLRGIPIRWDKLSRPGHPRAAASHSLTLVLALRFYPSSMLPRVQCLRQADGILNE